MRMLTASPLHQKHLTQHTYKHTISRVICNTDLDEAYAVRAVNQSRLRVRELWRLLCCRMSQILFWWINRLENPDLICQGNSFGSDSVYSTVWKTAFTIQWGWFSL